MYSLLHCCFITNTISGAILTEMPVSRGINVENLLQRCLIVDVKKALKSYKFLIKRGFVRQNLFDCCLINIRIQGLGLRIEERVDA